MLILPELSPKTIEELVGVHSEEAYVAELERAVESKAAELRDWKREALVVGKTQAGSQEIQAGIEDDHTGGLPRSKPQGHHKRSPSQAEPQCQLYSALPPAPTRLRCALA
ncbi:hypothetical protein HaLaN_26264 [Haematococcus lacustris]|uniref:Uncharacterized protein n=1 Tax=Haematococcus lacustris TaxID=44745 RepID=A0A699ZVS1_HAELA|nr:hypothetical protein HaLaN_19847 [Haematococcus lacustris]GFH27877.1 hypothetical protein HaLaN_26264 [Haematococcus lacustris]